MKAEYRGFDIDVNRDYSIMGDRMIFYSVFRQSDLWEFDSGYDESDGTPLKSIVKRLKAGIDDYYLSPSDYQDVISDDGRQPKGYCAGCGKPYYKKNVTGRCKYCYNKSRSKH